MTAPGPKDLSRFRFLATFAAGRPVLTAEARSGEPAHTDGRIIFASAGRPAAEQRREILLQSALLAAGSLDQRWVRALRARPALARRYLALEGRRALAELARRMPLADDIRPDGDPGTTAAEESLEVAKGRAKVPDTPEWFGVIRASRLSASPDEPGGRPTDRQLHPEADLSGPPEDDEDDEQTEKSRLLRLFEVPLGSQAIPDFLRKLLGSEPRSSGDDAAGAELPTRSLRRARSGGPDARPLPTRIHFTDDGDPGASAGVGGALHPEWDVHANRYRPEWCRVVDFPLTATADVSAAGIPRDDVLRRRLSRVGLGPRILRRRADGDELDIDALADLAIDVRCGYTPPEHVYQERRNLQPDLGVLILVDASGSATDTDPDGLAVHDHQRRSAATLALTLEELGARVAVYAFRSHGRHAVHLPAIKTFGQRFGAAGRARLNRLRPSGYTRLGAGIRGAREILERDAGTPNRLLLVLSDGFPYDGGYEGRYAEADVQKALVELRIEGVACLCLSIGTTHPLPRVFGPTGHAAAPTLAELSPRMDELFLLSLQDLTAPKSRRLHNRHPNSSGAFLRSADT
ncbi:nitric oxide reductase activation protein NorD [Actinomadura sp. WMMB 499]|uniref:nitric oxide reductase activation protein NorD n=1 Tax=Actinomadura sp. WMMB 499 TaxID=1219491 RepID=UPI001243E966|nr:VWA domain-containing protein [Actinomadura sp. WMMB 499]QFG22176.1 VWA domain-containing protein [Actinomadura sp. WMMB 499]